MKVLENFEALFDIILLIGLGVLGFMAYRKLSGLGVSDFNTIGRA